MSKVRKVSGMSRVLRVSGANGDKRTYRPSGVSGKERTHRLSYVRGVHIMCGASRVHRTSGVTEGSKAHT